jgi:hypothetical protein
MAKQKFDRLKMVALWHKNNGNEMAVARALKVSRAAIRKARNGMDPILFELRPDANFEKMYSKIAHIANVHLYNRLLEKGHLMSDTALNKIGGTAQDKRKTEQGLPSAIEGHLHVGALSPEVLEAMKEFNRIRSEEKMKAITYEDDN